MGQAKVRRAQMLREHLDRLSEWDFPPSTWEADICRELADMPILTVPCAPQDQLAGMPMRINECHQNARRYAKNDPDGEVRAISGWWVVWPDYLLHSVVKIDRQLICITPKTLNETEIPFIPDSNISWVETGGVYSAIRNGQKIGPGVRAYPDFSLARIEITRSKLLAGIDPAKAMELTQEELKDLKQKYVDKSCD